MMSASRLDAVGSRVRAVDVRNSESRHLTTTACARSRSSRSAATADRASEASADPTTRASAVCVAGTTRSHARSSEAPSGLHRRARRRCLEGPLRARRPPRRAPLRVLCLEPARDRRSCGCEAKPIAPASAGPHRGGNRPGARPETSLQQYVAVLRCSTGSGIARAHARRVPAPLRHDRALPLPIGWTSGGGAAQAA